MALSAGLGRPALGQPAEATGTKRTQWFGSFALCNDPSAGSPTETLLRLLLPLNDRVWIAFRPWAVVAHYPGQSGSLTEPFNR